MSVASWLRKQVGMSTKEEGGSQENVGQRGKAINRELCKAGQEEYCPPKSIPTPTPGDGSRSKGEMKKGVDRYTKRSK